MKRIFYACALMLIVGQALAQKNIFSHGIDICIPQNGLTSVAKTGWGTSFRYERVMASRLNATMAVSALFFGKKSLTIPTQPPMTLTTKSIMIPIQAGLKYFILRKEQGAGLFVNGESGIHILTGKGTVNGTEANLDSSTNFSYSLGTGYKFGMFELSYRQQFVSNGSQTMKYSDVRLSWFLNKRR